mmetsp:Transcript_2201/g.6255  ORF Transcript_2201/g.6255 Transcript_2201/m.6255 type:complete len:285 (+) Transcript_2201:261-1115(+)
MERVATATGQISRPWQLTVLSHLRVHLKCDLIPDLARDLFHHGPFVEDQRAETQYYDNHKSDNDDKRLDALLDNMALGVEGVPLLHDNVALGCRYYEGRADSLSDEIGIESAHVPPSVDAESVWRPTLVVALRSQLLGLRLHDARVHCCRVQSNFLHDLLSANVAETVVLRFAVNGAYVRQKRDVVPPLPGVINLDAWSASNLRLLVDAQLPDGLVKHILARDGARAVRVVHAELASAVSAKIEENLEVVRIKLDNVVVGGEAHYFVQCLSVVGEILQKHGRSL